jgi:hypothetical protein
VIEASSAAARRLRDLGAEAPVVAPLWIETLPPEEALAAARAREGAVFRLQEADALLALGRSADAAAMLAGLGPLPQGLSALRERLSDRAGPVASAPPPPAGRETELRRWLERVRSWRAAGRV